MLEILLAFMIIYFICDGLFEGFGWRICDTLASACVMGEIISIFGLCLTIVFGYFQYISFILF